MHSQKQIIKKFKKGTWERVLWKVHQVFKALEINSYEQIILTERSHFSVGILEAVFV